MKKLYIVGGAVILMLAVVAAYSASQPSPPSQTSETKVTVSPSTQATQASPAAEGKYIDYSPGILEATEGTKILFFHAPWCPQCRKLDQSIKDGTIPVGVTIIKADYDSNQALRKQYGVTIQTTLVRVNDDGTLAKRYVAYDTPDLAAVTDNLLD